jgi:hypothetical protein
MKVVSTNPSKFRFRSPCRGDFTLKNDVVYRVENIYNHLRITSVDNTSSFACEYSDFREYLREGLLKIVLEK